MRRRNRNIFWMLLNLFWLMLMIRSVAGQQQFLFSQYMFNGLLVNPAYAGSDKYMNLTAQHRMQWPGAHGAPVLSLVSWHTPLGKSNVGLGATVGQETVGVSKNMNASVAGSYKVKLNNDYRLVFGLQAGVKHYQENLTELTVPSQYVDPTISSNVRYTIPDFGAGVYLYNPTKLFLGLSSSSLTQNLLTKKSISNMKEIRHYYLYGGYMIEASDKVKIKPNVLIRSSYGAPVNVDFNVNVLLENIFWVGVSYRYQNSISPVVELLLNKKLRIGMSYDISTQVYGNSFRYGSPEVMINYRFVKLLPNTVISPRVF